MKPLTIATCLLVAGLSTGCMMGPRAPNVQTFPGRTMSYEEYTTARRYCAWAAQQEVAPASESSSGESAVAGGLIGGMVGAGAGAIIGAVTGSPSTGAAIGGVSGALLGAAGGASAGQQQGLTAQQMVDNEYRACAVASGLQVEAPQRYRRMMSRERPY